MTEPSMGTEREERDAALAELDRARSRLREVEAEHSETYQLYRQALKDNADFAMRVEQAEARVELLEAELEKAADTFQELATYLHLGLGRARGVLRKGETEC